MRDLLTEGKKRCWEEKNKRYLLLFLSSLLEGRPVSQNQDSLKQCLHGLRKATWWVDRFWGLTRDLLLEDSHF